MEEGKFSRPRKHREEERQIEDAFRQVTGQAPPKRPTPRQAPLEQTQQLDLDTLLTQEEAPAQEEPLPRQDTLPQQEIPFAKRFSLFPEEAPEFEEAFPDAAEEDEPAASWMDTALDVCTRYRKQILLGLCAGAAVLVIAVIAAIFMGSSDPYDGRILNNVYLGDINVGGMTKSQAASALKSVEQAYSKTDMVVTVGQQELRFTPKDSGVQFRVKDAVAAAYNYGRTGTAQQQQEVFNASQTEPHIIALLPYLKLNTDYIRTALDDFAQASGSTLTQTSYGLEGVQPNLSTDQFDPAAPGQTLVITMGTPGTGFDSSDTYNQVLDAYSMGIFQVQVADVTQTAEPDPIDLEAIYKEFYIAPVDASIDLNTYKPVPGSYGCDFDLENAKALVEKAKHGDILRIPIVYTAPEIADDNVYFRDVLGEYQTAYTNNQNRNTNLRLACQALDGLVLNPGETFSYNDTLGERTSAKGYKPAPAYSGEELVDSVGGGICQVSSTLYYATLLSDLEIVSRTNHGFPATYIPYGLDATVSWRSPDFKFRNSTSFPIRLEAKAENGYVTIRVLGTDQRGYYVKMEYRITSTQEPETEYVDFDFDNDEGYRDGDVIQEGATGYTVKTYRVKYDNQTGAQISRDYETTSQYMRTKRLVARVAPEKTEPPTTQPPATTQPPETTQPPQTTAPPETTQPVETTQIVEPKETVVDDSTSQPTQEVSDTQEPQALAEEAA